MSKFFDPSVPDAALNEIATSDLLSITSAQPVNLAALPGVTLASVAMAPGDYTLANGDVSGRKVSVALKSAIPITASGTATHLVLSTATELKAGTTCVSQVLTSGGTVSQPGFDFEIQDPV